MDVLRGEKTKMLDEVFRILVVALGQPPQVLVCSSVNFLVSDVVLAVF